MRVTWIPSPESYPKRTSQIAAPKARAANDSRYLPVPMDGGLQNTPVRHANSPILVPRNSIGNRTVTEDNTATWSRPRTTLLSGRRNAQEQHTQTGTHTCSRFYGNVLDSANRERSSATGTGTTTDLASRTRSFRLCEEARDNRHSKSESGDRSRWKDQGNKNYWRSPSSRGFRSTGPQGMAICTGEHRNDYDPGVSLPSLTHRVARIHVVHP